MEIIKYNNSNNISVKFDDGTIVNANVNNFKQGRIKNPNTPSILGIGIVGNKYPIKDENNKLLKEYITWSHMISRCYKNRGTKKDSAYLDCEVCKEWIYYPNFYEWLHKQDNYEKWLSDKYMIDKDIIEKGNKIYSPSKCCLVPYYINMLFTKHDAKRGKYPIGVLFNNLNNCFDVRVNDGVLTGKKSIHLTGFLTQEEAFYKYKELKERIIKFRAKQEYLQGNITQECYKGMMKYQVEITD